MGAVLRYPGVRVTLITPQLRGLSRAFAVILGRFMVEIPEVSLDPRRIAKLVIGKIALTLAAKFH
jgi:hypothetical protein